MAWSRNTLLVYFIIVVIISSTLYVRIINFSFTPGQNQITESSAKVQNKFKNISRYEQNMQQIFVEELGFQSVTVDGPYIYSAFLGNGGDQKIPKLLIIGIDATKAVRNLSCSFYTEIPSNSDVRKVGVETDAIKRNSADSYNTDLKYCPMFIECEIPEMGNVKYVVVVNNLNDSEISRNLLRIHYPPKQPIYNIAACLQPLYTMENVTENNPLPLIEWLEFQKMMGVEHFTFYNLSASPAIVKVLETYKEVSILPWNIPITSKNHIRARGQYMQANDCAHRYRGVARIVITLDFDEFLIPSANFSDYPSMFKYIFELDEVKKLEPINQLKFMATFSFANWPKLNNTNFTAEYYNVDFLRMPTMTNFIGSGQTKFAILPENVMESGVHFVKRGIPGSKEYTVSRTVGQYLHFRWCSKFFQKVNPTLNGKATCLLPAPYVENVEPSERFGDKVVKRVDHKVGQLLLDIPEFEKYLEINNEDILKTL